MPKYVCFPFNFHRICREQIPFSTSYSLGWAWKTFSYMRVDEEFETFYAYLPFSDFA